MKTRKHRKPAPQIVVAENEDRSQAIVKAGRHYAKFHGGKEQGSFITALERANAHADMLAVSFKGKLGYRRSAGPRQQASDKGTAVDYALWLARRDNIDLPNVYGTPHFTTIASAYERTPKGRPVMLKRCMFVTFGKVTINIPNWDFEPAPARSGATLAIAA